MYTNGNIHNLHVCHVACFSGALFFDLNNVTMNDNLALVSSRAMHPPDQPAVKP